MDVQKTDTAVVFIDPQNDVLSETGANWGAVGASVTENRTVENMERIFEAAKRSGYEVFISPHYFYPTDDGWKMNGPLEADEFRTHTFARKGPLTLTGFANSGADWLDRFKRYIEDGKTIVVSPHKVFGPQTNDLVLQLRKRGISKIILGGMFVPFALVRGHAVGTWTFTRGRVVLSPLEDLAAADQQALRADAADVERFLGAAGQPPADRSPDSGNAR